MDQDDWIHQTNIEESMGALYDAGWYLNEEGVRENYNGDTLTLYLIRRVFDDAQKEKVASMTAEIIKNQLAQVGIEVVIEAYQNEDLQEKIKNREYDLLLYGQSLGYNLDTYSYWHSGQANEYGLNLSNYRNSNADQLIEAVRRTFDPGEKDELLRDLAETIAADIPAVFLYTPSYYFLVDKRVQGIDIDNLRFPSDRFATIADWYFE
ncbi:MAG: hypothetical protein ACD_65C00080G0001 [uncultured bacterium]|nr:MAG: hypothetical protein ACD_65C00080G0001 [uncultured bacterium]